MLAELELRLNPDPLRPAAGWFFAGSDPQRWLEELIDCGLAELDTRLFVVGKGTEELSTMGVLAIPAKQRQLSRQPRGVACGQIADKLFLPIEAALWPPLKDSEVRDLCDLSVVFFHPALGLSGFNNEQALRVCDLLKASPQLAGNWNLAQPSPAHSARFRGIVLADPAGMEDIFGEESEEIGSEKDEVLPPAPGEPKQDPLSKAKRRAQNFFARKVSDLLRHLPHGGQRNWLNQIEDWANRQVQGISAQLEQLRNKELHRLLHLLDSDPEAGLRHAIPLNDFAHRGRGRAGARLGEHDLSFDPGHIGGGPVDYWNIPNDLQAELTRRYRAMANREMQLGRHRRAAYIYAELLGDLASAAATLKQGGFFREAALLYEERLHNPLAAAQCLADGGLVQEALQRYEKLGRWLEVADLYERLGNAAKAQAALRIVVKQRLGSGDVVGAADLLEKRLNALDEALQLLDEAWPRSRHALQCLAAQFALLGKAGRPESALKRLHKLRREKLSGSYHQPLAGLLADVATSFPDQRVRHDSADIARVFISQLIAETSLPDSKASELVRQLYRLAPNDRLLTRDGNRHLANRRAREIALRGASPVKPAPADRELKVVRTLDLPRQIEWICARANGPWFFAAGITPRHLTLLRGTWDGEFQSLTWNCSATAVKQGLLCEPVNQPGNRRVIISVAGHDNLKEQFFPPDLYISRSCVAGTPDWLSCLFYPFTVADCNLWSTHVAGGKAVLSCYAVGGGLLRTIDITSDLLDGATRTSNSRLCIGHIDQGAVLALGDRLLLSRGDGPMDRVELPGDAKGLVPTLRHTRPGVLVLLEHGALMHWLGHENLIEMDKDTAWISAAWTASGKLVLVSAREICLVDVDTRGIHAVKRTAWHGKPPVAVIAAGEPCHFAVFTAHGDVAVFNIPG
jgi:tetratricopeptide (TPR) repeat protein